MKRCVPAVLILFSLCINTSLHADLNDDVNAVVHDKALEKMEVGVEVVELGDSVATSRVVYRSRNDQAMIPASNLKVITTSAALDRLGPDFKFRTQLAYHDGDLILIGDGDPSFGDAELLTRVGWDVTTVFQNWAKQVKQLQLGPIKSVVVDDSIFDDAFFHPTWPAEQRNSRYEAEVSGMNLNMNCVDVFLRPARAGTPVGCVLNPPTHYVTLENLCLSGEGKPWMSRDDQGNKITLRGKASTANDVPASITIHDGPMFAATVLNETLTSAGVACQQPARRDRTLRDAMIKAIAGGDKSWQVVAIHETPLPQVLSRANKDSMNLYGECLCKRLGADVSGQPGSWANGTAAVGDFLRKIGTPDGSFKLYDGCGLSKLNAVSASTMSRVLMHDFFSPNARIFMDSLSVAGSDGTLSDRFANTSLRGRVFAKTGTVTGVSCLSGYLNAQDGKHYAFSILMNKNYAGLGKPAQERIIVAIDNATAKAARAR